MNKIEIATPTDRFVQQLMETIASYDNSMRSDIVSRAMCRKAEQGYSPFRPPLGYIKTEVSGLYKKDNTASTLSRYFKDTLEGRMTVPELR